jgi:hypothetical protein
MFISRKSPCAMVIAALAAGCGHTDLPAPSQSQALSPPSATAAPSNSAPRQPRLRPSATDELRAAAIASGDSCNVEALGESVFGPDPITVAAKATTISGWFLSGVTKKSGVPARLQLIAETGSSNWQIPFQLSLARPDVLAAMGAWILETLASPKRLT